MNNINYCQYCQELLIDELGYLKCSICNYTISQMRTEIWFDIEINSINYTITLSKKDNITIISKWEIMSDGFEIAQFLMSFNYLLGITPFNIKHKLQTILNFQ